MKERFKLQIILIIICCILIPFHLYAQKGFIPKQAIENQGDNFPLSKNEIFEKTKFITHQRDELLGIHQPQIINHSQIIKDFSEHRSISSEIIPQAMKYNH